MRLDSWDMLAGADVATDDADLLVITQKGFGKRTPLTEYRRQGRYGQGIKVMNLSPERTGAIVAARVVSPKDEVTLISSGGIILRMSGSYISRQGRGSTGVRVMDLRDADAVVSVAVLPEARQALEEAGEELAALPNGDGEVVIESVNGSGGELGSAPSPSP